ncbi:DEAD-box ATP-dependent RNA helicase 38 [Populus alba x Populus x berolinensis]|uniref:RNA helicase n=2 Tax=Populus TaxID=3689 RepID=A0A4U5QQT1_POPAL|nr:DEAD-box ATP-dependent RNA helicase 38 [Populus alba]KAJ6922795.1 DEAD-box ATP-dependent RNA helicase 38 [Populus alba x Populus x berolinensis]KAJ6993272.1 DEAD-box ATP-dependent RNA helicase 38 [Populus alba x Populus x berolinensis]TKS13218.1 DEAD box RNA helicase [Populus alba]
MAEVTETTAASSSEGKKPAVPETKRLWGDEVDDEEVQPSATEEKAVSELNVDALAIDENTKVNKFLDEPEDSRIQAVTTGDTPYTSASTFEDLNLSPELLKGLYVEMKFQKPSKIQAISLPMIMTPPYKDLIAQAHNGSGKTTCFVLGMLSRVDPQLQRPQALCICPTRELSIQNMEVLRKMGKYTGISSECAVPIESRNNDRSRSRPPISAQVVIGTPGTIKRLMSQKKLGVTDMKVLVFDEADHMLAKDGFQDDSLRIMKDIQRFNSHCQVLLFSATFDETVKNFVSKVVKDYNQLFVKKEDLSLESLKQYKVILPDELAKIGVVKDRILELGENIGQIIIFVNTKRSASMLHTSLVDLGYEVTTIHGALNLEDRDKIVKEFKDGLTQVLISTDVLARGFDQQQVNLVINYDLPVKYENQSEPHYEVYLHRIGRAGRFGRKGAVFNFIMTDHDLMIMRKIESYFNSPVAEIPSWGSEEDYKAALKEAGLL